MNAQPVSNVICSLSDRRDEPDADDLLLETKGSVSEGEVTALEARNRNSVGGQESLLTFGELDQDQWSDSIYPPGLQLEAVFHPLCRRPQKMRSKGRSG